MRDFPIVRAGDDAVVLQGVRKRYTRRGSWVLGGVDLALPAGAATVIVGSNGSGKSTLLRLIVGLTRPTAGTVGTRATSVAFAPERLAGNIRMTARLYLAHMAALRRVEPRVAGVRTEELARQFGLLPGLDAPIRSLSKGNSQKVALMQAFLAPVELIVLDEPYSGLDETARAAVDELVAASVDAGSAVALSSHIPVELHGASRILRIDDGRLTGDRAGASRAVEIRLTHADRNTSSEALRDGPGIIAVREDSTGEAILTVVSAESDRTLRDALDRGWSVRSVRPSHSGDDRKTT